MAIPLHLEFHPVWEVDSEMGEFPDHHAIPWLVVEIPASSAELFNKERGLAECLGDKVSHPFPPYKLVLKPELSSHIRLCGFYPTSRKMRELPWVHIIDVFIQAR